MHLRTDFKHLFPGQQANERVYLMFRQHWIVLVSRLAVWFLFLAIYAAVDYSVSRFFPYSLGENARNFIELAKLLYLASLALGLFIIWAMYYLNINIVTNERIVDITQKNLLHNTVSELHLNQIEDVTAETKGMFQTFFNYGNVYIQTAGETNYFEFTKVPRPTHITKVILDLYEQLPPEKKQIKP